MTSEVEEAFFLMRLPVSRSSSFSWWSMMKCSRTRGKTSVATCPMLCTSLVSSMSSEYSLTSAGTVPSPPMTVMSVSAPRKANFRGVGSR